MDVAERRVMLKGNDLTQEGRPHEEVFLIVEGTAEVRAQLTGHRVLFPPSLRSSGIVVLEQCASTQCSGL